MQDDDEEEEDDEEEADGILGLSDDEDEDDSSEDEEEEAQQGLAAALLVRFCSVLFIACCSNILNKLKLCRLADMLDTNAYCELDVFCNTYNAHR